MNKIAKITGTLSIICFINMLCACGSERLSEQDEEDAGIVYSNVIYLTEIVNEDIPGEIGSQIPKTADNVLAYQNGENELFLYTDELEAHSYQTADSYIHLFLNGTEHIMLDYGKYFVTRHGEQVKLINCDMNADGKDDIVLCGACDRGGDLIYVFIREDDTYCFAGSPSWDMNLGEFADAESLKFDVQLRDYGEAEIIVPREDINEIVEIPDQAMKYVFEPEIDDPAVIKAYKGGILTEAGKTWYKDDVNLKEISTDIVRENDRDFLCVKYEVLSNYSDIGIGHGLQILWEGREQGLVVHSAELW